MALWPSCDFNFWRLVHPRQSIIMALWPSCDLNFWRFAILIVSIGILTIIAAGRPGLVTIHWIVPAKSNQSGFFVTYFGLLWTWPYDPEVDHFMHLTCGTLVTICMKTTLFGFQNIVLRSFATDVQTDSRQTFCVRMWWQVWLAILAWRWCITVFNICTLVILSNFPVLLYTSLTYVTCYNNERIQSVCKQSQSTRL